ncbi:MAG: DNA polymerase III subunit delta, partial [Bacteroidaceae bacterium]|nr:DNA polymerase III subunit delta [Bacteroidaceae bacterium]
MAKKTSSTSGITHRDIINAVRQQQYAPVYLLMGEESYYIDKISEFIANSVLAEEERDFNLITIYCTKETNVADVINSAKRYPMMSKYQVVIVKEAQNLLKFEDLQYYLKEPLLSTILVICYKNGV